MKASELIVELQAAIDEHGDHPVIADCYDTERAEIVDGVDFQTNYYGPHYYVCTDGKEIHLSHAEAVGE